MVIINTLCSLESGYDHINDNPRVLFAILTFEEKIIIFRRVTLSALLFSKAVRS